ncbi:hypothetical protein HJ114_23470 [Vibrio parahaemolyticus]|nr:hypothetical protein [Vibrio parahaemolyticus]
MDSNNEVFPKVEPKEDKLYRVAEAAFSFFSCWTGGIAISNNTANTETN